MRKILILFPIFIFVVFTQVSPNNLSISSSSLNIKLKKIKKDMKIQKHMKGISLIKSPAESVTEYLRHLQNLYYVGEVGFGNPQQKIDILFDSGSGEMWVKSHKPCEINETICASHKTYNSKKSKTYLKDGRPFSIQYITGAIEGFVSKDDVYIAGLRIRNQAFAEAVIVDEFTQQFEFDGIMGLAFPAKSRISSDPPFINMVKQKLVPEAVFAFYLSRNQLTAELTLGGVNPNRYKGTFAYTPILAPLSWKFEIDAVLLNKEDILDSYPALVDSGTSHIIAPKQYFDIINKAIGRFDEDDGEYYVDCYKWEHLPIITFVINGHKFPLGPEDYVIKDEEEDDPDKQCYSGFIGNEGITFIVLGNIFMQKYYVKYDLGYRRLGFAVAT